MPSKGFKQFKLWEKHTVYAPPFADPEVDGGISVVLTDMNLTPLVIAVKHGNSVKLMNTCAAEKIEHEYYRTGGRDVLMALALRVAAPTLSDEEIAESATSQYAFSTYWLGNADGAIRENPVVLSDRHYREGMFK